jgi:hypothetical protein
MKKIAKAPDQPLQPSDSPSFGYRLTFTFFKSQYYLVPIFQEASFAPIVIFISHSPH